MSILSVSTLSLLYYLFHVSNYKVDIINNFKIDVDVNQVTKFIVITEVNISSDLIESIEYTIMNSSSNKIVE